MNRNVRSITLDKAAGEDPCECYMETGNTGDKLVRMYQTYIPKWTLGWDSWGSLDYKDTHVLFLNITADYIEVKKTQVTSEPHLQKTVFSSAAGVSYSLAIQDEQSKVLQHIFTVASKRFRSIKGYYWVH